MKTVYLVRHAKAVKRKAKLPDFERALVKKGENQASLMAKRLKKEGLVPDLMISSPASRSLETAHIFADKFGYPVLKIMLKDALYEELSEEALLYVIRNLDDKYNSVMMFGHDPNFTNFAAYLIKSFRESIPKSGLVAVNVPKDHWKEISKGDGVLDMFDYPKRIEDAFSKMQKGLETDIENSIRKSFTDEDLVLSKKLEKSIRKKSKEMAKELVAAARILKSKKDRESKGKVKTKKKKSAPKKKMTEASAKADPKAKPGASKTSKSSKQKSPVASKRKPAAAKTIKKQENPEKKSPTEVSGKEPK